ncbi:MAG: type II toxin-antitoxin system VapC family toxin [Betaproteobacteria bacterium]
MNLDDIPAGSLCVADTNVLLYAEHGASLQAKRFIRRCSSGEVKAVLPQPVWQEFAHKLMLAEATFRGLIGGSNPTAKLAQKPDAVRSLTLYQAKVKTLIDLGFGFEPCQRADLVESAFALQAKHGLLTIDAVILAVALRLKADVLVSSDKAFRGVSELELYYPTDLRI